MATWAVTSHEPSGTGVVSRPLAYAVSVPPGGRVVADVAVVHGDERAGLDARDEVGPGLVAGEADLEAVTGRRSWASGPAPSVGRRPQSGSPSDSSPVVGSTSTSRSDAVGVDLGDGARHDVEPLVGDDEGVVQAGQLGRQGRATRGAEPLDPVVEARRAARRRRPRPPAVGWSVVTGRAGIPTRRGVVGRGASSRPGATAYLEPRWSRAASRCVASSPRPGADVDDDRRTAVRAPRSRAPAGPRRAPARSGRARPS